MRPWLVLLENIVELGYAAHCQLAYAMTARSNPPKHEGALTHEPPLVSIIMPAYNAEQFIYPAMTSILAQTYENYELIIVDDGSTDNTYDIVRSFNDRRIILIKNHKNLNLARIIKYRDGCR